MAKGTKIAMERHPRLARTVLDEVLHRFEQAQQTIRRLSADNSKQRVAAALLSLADNFGVAHKGAPALELPLTRVDMAALTGMTPETVSRVMSQFRDDGIIGAGRRKTVVQARRKGPGTQFLVEAYAQVHVTDPLGR